MSSSDDHSVLLELFRATNGPSWFRNDGWDTNASVSTWYGVTVDEGGHVVKLELRKNNLEGAIPESLGQLTNLTELNLAFNQLTGAIPESLGHLSKLQRLKLDNNQLSGAIPESLGQLSKLQRLYLANNQLSGAIPESLGHLLTLQRLNLANNQLSGAIPESLGVLLTLQTLNLANNQLSGAIPESLGYLSTLQRLKLDNNQLSGAIPESLGHLSTLQRLNLANNQLSGAIPEFLGQLSTLNWLILPNNKLSGAIPESLGHLSKVNWLYLANNQLSGAIPESLGHLSTLQGLSLVNNQLSGVIPESLGQLSKLVDLFLAINQLSGAIPESLGQLSALQTLNLANNQLSGAIPESLGHLSTLQTFNLANNQLSGAIPKSLGHLSKLQRLKLANNQLSGAIPESLGELSTLDWLDLANNQLSGAIPESLGQLSKLVAIFLANNQFSVAPGSLEMSSSDDRSVLLELFRATNGPSWFHNYGWDTNASVSTWYGVTVDKDGRVVKLELPGNRLQGAIPESLGQLTNLTRLYLSSNNLTGAVPESVGQLTNLTELYLSMNYLTGAIPESLVQLTNLTRLDLSSNKLTGAIPDSLVQLTNLTRLNLSGNRLTGAIPESLGELTNLTRLDLSGNRLTGAIPESLGQLTNLTRLSLSGNKLTGAIPESFGQLTNLTWFDLSANELTGAIPESLRQLTNLTDLSLSGNRLTGVIPESLGQLTNLTELGLWSNELIGAIPESLGQLTNLTKLYLHNNMLTDISEKAARGLQRLRLTDLYLDHNPWTSPPADVVDGGFEGIVGYWEAIKLSGFIVSWKLKVVLVGAVKAGKTSLAKGMIHGEPRLCHEDDRTKGVDVHVGKPCKPDPTEELEFIFWDFAGHSEYYSTHQVFLSKGALHLLVVDMKRFADEPLARGELVDVWLEALQCRVPGSSVLVIATQIDRFAGHLELALGDLRRTVEDHLSIKRNELERTRHDKLMPSDVQQSLIFHGVETVSSTRSESLMDLRSKLSQLVHTKRSMFPSVGRRRPISWARVAAMLDAKRSGNDPILQASRVAPVEQDQENLETITAGVKFLHRAGAIDEWRGVVQTLKLNKEVGSTLFDIAARKLRRGRNIERKGKKVIFEDAVEQLVREGTILDSGEVLYLEPTWINDLLRAILDHDLDDPTKEKFWKKEIQKSSGGDNGTAYDLKKIHDNFPSTGILTVRYLRFLWRGVTEIGDKVLFRSLLDTMSRHGIIFQGNPSGAGSGHAENVLNDSAELFVPLHLPSKILKSDLEEYAALFKGQFRRELVCEISQAYVPPGILGLLMARFLLLEHIEFRRCWSRGASFTLGEVLVLLYLDTPSHGKDEALITVNVFGEKFVSQLHSAMKSVEDNIVSVFEEFFGGLFIYSKTGYPRDVDGICAIGGRCATGGGNAVDSMGIAGIVDAVVERIDRLEAHINTELSLLLRGLRHLEENLSHMVKSCHLTLARLNKLQSEEVPCPNLLIVRPAAAMVLVGRKRSLRAMMEGLGRRAKSLVCKDMRLCFLCPHDFSEVPCGLDGNGYPLTATRDWVTQIRPALKVTAVLAKVAIKAASGLDVPVSDFLNGAKSYLGEELADCVLDDRAIEQALGESTVPGEGKVKTLIGEAYEELKKFMKEYKYKNREGFVHFDKLMQRVDDGDGGKVWVSKENVQRWNEALA